MKREAEYTPQEFVKITFDLLGSRRAGVVIAHKGVLIVHCLDKKSNESHQISPARTIGPKLSNIEFVGTVKPHANAYANRLKRGDDVAITVSPECGEELMGQIQDVAEKNDARVLFAHVHR